MTLSERRIRGIIRERGEAERAYQEAKGQGYVASLLTQERPNVFTQSVANIEPRKSIAIRITHLNTPEYVDGWYEMVVPLVVGPRFNPPGRADGVGAVGRGASGQRTEVQYLRPEQRSGQDVSLAVTLDAGVAIESVDSRNHKVAVRQISPREAVVTLDPADAIPNKHFVLRFKVAGEHVKSGLLVQRNEPGDGGYFLLMLFPPPAFGICRVRRWKWCSRSTSLAAWPAGRSSSRRRPCVTRYST